MSNISALKYMFVAELSPPGQLPTWSGFYHIYHINIYHIHIYHIKIYHIINIHHTPTVVAPL